MGITAEHKKASVCWDSIINLTCQNAHLFSFYFSFLFISACFQNKKQKAEFNISVTNDDKSLTIGRCVSIIGTASVA